MTKKQRKILGGIVIIIALILMMVAQSNKIPQEKSEASLWDLVNRMDWLRSLKEECVNNLNIVDSAKFLDGNTGYCDNWDAEIIELRNQINLMSKKDYEGLR